MTDRKPDDLFDALHERLADYGQEPPAALWAGIRAQLPPPVALPQLRRRRRWAPVALLLALVSLVSAAGWYAWTAKRLGSGSGASAVATVRQAPKPANPSAAAHAPSAATEAEVAGRGATSQVPAATTQTDPAGATIAAANADAPTLEEPAEYVAATAAQSSGNALRGTAAPTGPQPATAAPVATDMAHNQGARPNATGRALGTTAPEAVAASAARRHEAVKNGTALPQEAAGVASIASRTGTFDGRPTAALATGTSGIRNRARRRAAAPAPIAATAKTAAAKAPKAARARRETSGSDAILVAVLKNGAEKNPATPTLTAADTGASGAARLTKGPERVRPAAPMTDEATATVAPVSASWGNARRGPRMAEAVLPTRPVDLELTAGPVPAAPQPVAVSPTRPVVAARWALQVLAGPAYTFRTLSSTNSAPAVNSPPRSFSNAAAVTELERPALGGGVQASLSRTLTDNWALSAGLGYAEYATGLALQLVKSPTPASIGVAPAQNDSAAVRIKTRNTYRFVTLPVRLSYTTRLATRWRAGVVAGAEAAFYVGGRITEGAPCACQPQTYGPNNGPYRGVKVGVSAGAEVRYRLTERLEVLAQPTATYLLTPLARPQAGSKAHRLLGATALVGMSLDLR